MDVTDKCKTRVTGDMTNTVHVEICSLGMNDKPQRGCKTITYPNQTRFYGIRGVVVYQTRPSWVRGNMILCIVRTS